MARRRAWAEAGEIVAAIDVGASKAACMIAIMSRAADGRSYPETIGVGLHGEATERRGELRLDSSLRTALHAAERMAGARVRTALVAMSGVRLACRRVGVDLEIDGGRVTQDDVHDCLAHAEELCAGEGRRALHVAPIAFRIDEEIATGDVTGLCGRVLTVEAVSVLARESSVQNLDSLLERAGLSMSGAIAAPYAAGEAVLVDDEKALGAVILDLGASSTGFAVYENGALLDCGGVPVGGDHLTRDVAQLFGAPINKAERTKTLFGSALVGPGDDHRFVEIEQIGGGALRVPRAELSAVITPRLDEIFEMIATRLPTSARSRHGVRRAVLTGGGSLLIGARETAERVLGMKVRLGRPVQSPGAPDAATSPQFSVCAGMLTIAASARDGLGAPKARSRAGREAGFASAVGGWLKANF